MKVTVSKLHGAEVPHLFFGLVTQMPVMATTAVLAPWAYEVATTPTVIHTTVEAVETASTPFLLC